MYCIDMMLKLDTTVDCTESALNLDGWMGVWMEDIFSVSLLELQCFQLINFRLLLLLSCLARSHSVCLMYFLLALF